MKWKYGRRAEEAVLTEQFLSPPEGLTTDMEATRGLAVLLNFPAAPDDMHEYVMDKIGSVSRSDLEDTNRRCAVHELGRLQWLAPACIEADPLPAVTALSALQLPGILRRQAQDNALRAHTDLRAELGMETTPHDADKPPVVPADNRLFDAAELVTYGSVAMVWGLQTPEAWPTGLPDVAVRMRHTLAEDPTVAQEITEYVPEMAALGQLAARRGLEQIAALDPPTLPELCRRPKDDYSAGIRQSITTAVYRAAHPDDIF